MRREDVERLTTISVRGRRYVALDEVVALLPAKDTKATPQKTIIAEPDAPALPRRAADQEV